jgi:hypothetical protein
VALGARFGAVLDAGLGELASTGGGASAAQAQNSETAATATMDFMV